MRHDRYVPHQPCPKRGHLDMKWLIHILSSSFTQRKTHHKENRRSTLDKKRLIGAAKRKALLSLVHASRAIITPAIVSAPLCRAQNSEVTTPNETQAHTDTREMISLSLDSASPHLTSPDSPTAPSPVSARPSCLAAAVPRLSLPLPLKLCCLLSLQRFYDNVIVGAVILDNRCCD
ncbi:hypothetical protein PIB30_024000 [Stylosanthes scabra]|uniref:Uncharacterized protein n=1 Tax=Stylosanthes scabra TaxID=79078 RepID=A0ABU6Z9A0_9FABA|nr:hypothetical protein [Stylosanthes scabra]